MMEIPRKIKTFLTQLEEDGHQAYLVGGAVRDMLMGNEPEDWDIATSALPDQILATFRYIADVKQIDAESFPVIKVDGVDVATFRKDVYKDGVTVKTIPQMFLDQDLSRRDLTINAMAMDKDGNIFDPYGGEKDLIHNRIRFVGDAKERIIQDPCRIFRASRFNALLDGGRIIKFDREPGFIREQAKKVAPERIRLEMLKAMKYKKASKFFETLHAFGILDLVSPSLEKTWGADHGQYHAESIFEHMMIAGDFIGENFPEHCTKSPLFRLTAYLHDVGKSQPNFKDGEIHFYEHDWIGADLLEEELKALKFSTNEIKYITNLVSVHMRGGVKMAPKTVRKLLKKFTELDVDWKDWLALKVADRAANLRRDPFTDGRVKKMRDKFLHELNPEPTEQGTRPCFEHKHLAMSGTQIQNLLGIGPSQLVGVILDWLLNQVIGDPSLNTNKKLTALIKGSRKKKK